MWIFGVVVLLLSAGVVMVYFGERIVAADRFHDPYLGLKVEDPSIDLSVICALLSSYDDVPLSPHICFAGEVGLNGEIRAVNRIEQRIAEAEKLGFEKIIVSRFNKKGF